MPGENAVFTPRRLTATVVPNPDHEFDFRGCDDGSATADTGVDGSGITATAMNGATYGDRSARASA